MKHVKGDKVIVREDLVHGAFYGSHDVNDEMLDLCGTQVIIENVYPSVKHYTIKESIYCWTDEMFEDEKPNCMMVWCDNEKNAKKKEVIADLTNNPRYNGSLPIKCLSDTGVDIGYKYAKSIEEWKKDTGFLFKNNLHERFFVGDEGCVVKISSNEMEKLLLKQGDVVHAYPYAFSEVMTKGSAEKYIKEHEVKYRPFTMEEFIKANSNWIISKDIKEGLYVVKCNSTGVYVYDGLITYESLLKQYIFEDGTPCGVILK